MDQKSPYLRPGVEVAIGVSTIAGLGTSQARVLSVDESSLSLQTDGRLLLVRPGVRLEIQVPDRGISGWSQLLQVDPEDERNLMVLSLPRWIDGSRKPRREAEYRVKVAYVEPSEEGPRLRQVAGVTSNVSLTGAKLLMSRDLEASQTYQVDIFLEADEPCVAIAKVVRVGRSSAQKEQCEVGIQFVRFVSGLANYVATFESIESDVDEAA